MKVFKFQFYRLPFTYEQEDRFYKEEHVNLYKINWNSDSVNNQISWDFTDPLNPKIRVVGKLVGYKNNVLVEAENDFNYCYVEYGENSSKLMKQYFFTIPIKRLSFNAYEYTLKLDVIMTYWIKFYYNYKNTKFIIQRATLHQITGQWLPTKYGIMAYTNSEFEDVIYNMDYNYMEILPNMGIDRLGYKYQINFNEPETYCIYSINSNNKSSIIPYIESEFQSKFNNLIDSGIPCYIYCGDKAGRIYDNMSYVVRTSTFPNITKVRNTTFDGVVNLFPIIKSSNWQDNFTGYHQIPLSNYKDGTNSASILYGELNIPMNINKYILDTSYFEIIKIQNWSIFDGFKKEIITKLTPFWWPDNNNKPTFRYRVSLNSDLLVLSPTDIYDIQNRIFWDMTHPTSYSFPKIEEYMRENRNQIDNARAIGDQEIKLANWERNTAAAGHVEGMIRGGLSGFGTGALIGSVVPGIGTAIGGVVGAIGGALTGGAISGGFNAYGVGNTKIDIAKLERQSIEAKIKDVRNANPIVRGNSNDYTNHMFLAPWNIYLRKNKIDDTMLSIFSSYYNRFGSKYNIRITMSEIIENNKREYWYYIQTENMYKNLDDYFPTYIKNELSNVFDNGIRLHHTLDRNKFNLEVFNRQLN